MALVAKEFGSLPAAVAREMGLEPEEPALSLACISLLRYADAHAAFTRADKTELKGWKGSAVMDQVQENAFALAAAELGVDG